MLPENAPPAPKAFARRAPEGSSPVTGPTVKFFNDTTDPAIFDTQQVPRTVTPVTTTEFPDPEVVSSNFGTPSTCTQHSIVNSQGGPVVTTPNVHLVFWGNNWNSDLGTKNGHINTWSAMSATPAFYTRLGEYGVQPGTYAGQSTLSTALSGSLPETTLTNALITFIGTSTTTNDIWVVFLPSGTSSQYDTNNGFAAHHQVVKNGAGQNIVYAVIEYGDGDPLISHEIMEAATDPYFTSFIDLTGPLCGNEQCEIGDPCQAASNFRNIAGHNVEQIWSQKACRCVTEKDLDTVDYPNFLGSEDLTVFRPSNTQWYVKNENTTDWLFGASTDYPYAGDFDGDGKAEFALFRPVSSTSASIFILNTTSGVFSTNTFGEEDDDPVHGDFDGDGKSDIAVWRPSNGSWYVIPSGGGSYGPVQWGLAGDFPVPGDYDGDGKTDTAVFRPSTKSWYVILSSTGGTETTTWTGGVGVAPVPGDYNGDGKTDWAYWDGSTWHITYNGTSTAFTQSWGLDGDIPLLGDYDNDWQTDMAVWRPSTGHWYVIESSTASGTDLGAWGQQGDVPIQRFIPR
ncbi:MAG TPA: VCBS repeat-containing protein [Polyangiaceae bacterium]|nr:VCBS repeat-containing protein [Polyangiaceae bacterium]